MIIIDELTKTNFYNQLQNIRNAKLVEETEKDFKIAIKLKVIKSYA